MRRAVFGWVLVAATLAARGDTRADDGGAAREHRLRVVARVGPATITAGALEDRIAVLPPFQRASFGGTRDAVRRAFLSEVVLRETLLALGAEGLRLGDQPPAAYQIERARSAATIRAIRARIGPAAAIPMDEVERYYDENRARYDVPERYQIWRILCKTREDAQSVLEASKTDPTPATFGALAREHSLDRATYLRSGNLGFITADGSSNEPGLRVDPAIVRAAQSVRDGALAAEPVAEGEYFAVVWRRGTIAPTKRTVADAAAQIRDVLWKARVKDETDKLVAGLRTTRLRALDTSLLGSLDLPVDAEGGGAPKARADAGAH
jgi:peptidyl-prolyl cis-trans isomerase C